MLHLLKSKQSPAVSMWNSMWMLILYIQQEIQSGDKFPDPVSYMIVIILGVVWTL